MPWSAFALCLFLVASLAAAQDPSVAELTSALGSPNPARQRSAALGLAERGPEAAAALPVLLDALARTTQADELRSPLLAALQSIGPGDGSAVFEHVEDEHLADLSEVLELWLASDLDLSPLAPTLLEVMAYHWELKKLGLNGMRAFEESLRRAGEGHRQAAERALRDPRPPMRQAGCTLVLTVGPPERAVALIGEAFEAEQDLSVARRMATSLIFASHRFDPGRRAALHARILGDPRVEIRIACAEGLAIRFAWSEPLPGDLEVFDALLDDPEVRRALAREPGFILKHLDYARILIPSLREGNSLASTSAKRLGEELVEDGGFPGWFVARVYALELSLALALTVVWVGAASLVSRRGWPGSRLRWALLAGLPPGLVLGATVYYVLARPWATSFFPAAPTSVPLKVTGGLSTLGCVLLLALGAVRGSAAEHEPRPETSQLPQ
ncbi:MAG: hypothetical protein R3F62_09620 [Planctomycetota bacterium]